MKFRIGFSAESEVEKRKAKLFVKPKPHRNRKNPLLRYTFPTGTGHMLIIMTALI